MMEDFDFVGPDSMEAMESEYGMSDLDLDDLEEFERQQELADEDEFDEFDDDEDFDDFFDDDDFDPDADDGLGDLDDEEFDDDEDFSAADATW